MKMSISLNFFKAQYPIFEKNGYLDFYKLPQILADKGFSYIEAHPNMFTFSTNTNYIKNIVESSNIKIYSAHLPMVGNTLSFDKSIYKSRLDYLKSWIDTYYQLGVKVVVTHPDELSFDEVEHPKMMKILIKHSHELADYAKQYNMKVALETTWLKRSLFAYTNNIQQFKDSIKADNLGFCFDTGHAYGSEVPNSDKVEDNFWNTWNIMKDKIFTFHLHNTEKYADMHMPLSEGKINFKEFFREVKEMNYDFPLTLEIKISETDNLSEVLSKIVNDFKELYDE